MFYNKIYAQINFNLIKTRKALENISSVFYENNNNNNHDKIIAHLTVLLDLGWETRRMRIKNMIWVYKDFNWNSWS